METDYSKFSIEEYEKSVKKYILFNLMDLSGFELTDNSDNNEDN